MTMSGLWTGGKTHACTETIGFLSRRHLGVLSFHLLGDRMVKGRCMKCKQERDMKDVKEVVMKNGMKAAKGKCAVCGTTIFKIIGKA